MQKDFSKIPTDLNSMYIYKELVKCWRKLETISFFRPERVKSATDLERYIYQISNKKPYSFFGGVAGY